MLKPIHWENSPIDFEETVWQGNGKEVADAPAVINREKSVSIFKMELTENDRRQLIEGNPLYISMLGKVIPFMASANLAEITEIVRNDL